jgi:hypothetical protein
MVSAVSYAYLVAFRIAIALHFALLPLPGRPAAPPSTTSQNVFVGDSITLGWTTVGASTWNAYLAPMGCVDHGFPGLATAGLYQVIEQGGVLPSQAPRTVVLMVGAVDVYFNSRPVNVAWNIDVIRSLIEQKERGTRVIILKLLPMGPAGSSTRAVIGAINALLPADSVDVGSELLAPDGSFLPGVIQSDLVHPTAVGYALMGPRVLKAIEG